jgi:acyl-CoA synthetase (AMP-forming)/AMP-acid ligase II
MVPRLPVEQRSDRVGRKAGRPDRPAHAEQQPLCRDLSGRGTDGGSRRSPGRAGARLDAFFAEIVHSLRTTLPSVADRYIVTDGIETSTARSYEALIASGNETVPPEPADLSACYFQGYTSGTTGFPKGCVNPHREFADCLRRIATIYGITADDRELVAAPLVHEAPALFALLQIFRGGTVIDTSNTSPASVFATIDREKATWTFMVPTMWAAMVASEEIDRLDLGSLRLLLSGGSPLLTHTKEAILRRFPNAGLNEFYGAIEVGLVTNLSPEDQRRKVRSVGRPVIGMFVELRDEDGNVVPNGEVGEIHIGGATIIREYFNNPEATAQARKGGFFILGDMGRFDEEGYLYIVDRKKDMIISGGENIFPNDIEEVIYKHPAVEMAAVVGAPDPKWGEIVVAAVTLKPGHSADEAELIAHCKNFLSSFKVPKRIDFRNQMPMSSFGKMLNPTGSSRKCRCDLENSRVWRRHGVAGRYHDVGILTLVFRSFAKVDFDGGQVIGRFQPVEHVLDQSQPGVFVLRVSSSASRCELP